MTTEQKFEDILNSIETIREEGELEKLQTIINSHLPLPPDQLMRLSECTDIDLLYHAALLFTRLMQLEYFALDKELTVRRMMSIAEDCQS